MRIHWDLIPEWGWIWDESYNHNGYANEDEYIFIGMGKRCPIMVENSPLIPLGMDMRIWSVFVVFSTRKQLEWTLLVSIFQQSWVQPQAQQPAIVCVHTRQGPMGERRVANGCLFGRLAWNRRVTGATNNEVKTPTLDLNWVRAWWDARCGGWEAWGRHEKVHHELYCPEKWCMWSGGGRPRHWPWRRWKSSPSYCVTPGF
jgi:hypothetical protein